MKRILFYISILIIGASCSNNDKVVASLVKDKVNTMTGQEVVRDLLIENDGDQEQLARIFKCSIHTIDRVVEKKTYLTENALSEFRNLLVSVKVVGEEVFKENDPYYSSWFRSFRFWLGNNFWLFTFLFVITLLIIYLVEGTLLAINPFAIVGLAFSGGGFHYVLSLGVFLFCFGGIFFTWICNMIWSFEQPAYMLIEKINPVFETLL